MGVVFFYLNIKPHTLIVLFNIVLSKYFLYIIMFNVYLDSLLGTDVCWEKDHVFLPSTHIFEYYCFYYTMISYCYL